MYKSTLLHKKFISSILIQQVRISHRPQNAEDCTDISVHIIAQKTDGYIVAFPTTIWYDIDGDGHGCEQQAL